MSRNSVVIHSDAGTASTFFARAAGIVETVSPGTDAVDASQNFEKDNAAMVSAYLYTSVPFWPDGTVFLSMVGSGEPIAVRLRNGSYIVSPNNGTATMSAGLLGFDSSRHIDPDLYGSDGWEAVRCAAALAGGASFESIGPLVAEGGTVFFSMEKAVIGEGYAEGAVGMLLRNFGNITFTIGTDEFEDTGIRTGDRVRVTFTRNGEVQYDEDMTYQPSFGYVPVGDPVVFNGSSGYMDIGLNMKSFIDECIPQILDCPDPGEFKVRIEKITGENT